MIFANRTEAGHELALRLRTYANRDDVIVLGAPRYVPRSMDAVAVEKVQGEMEVEMLRLFGVAKAALQAPPARPARHAHAAFRWGFRTFHQPLPAQ